MLYLAHFGMREHPFFPAPTPDHYVPTPQSEGVLQRLEQAVVGTGRLIGVTGPAGSGKTLLSHLLIQRLTRRRSPPVDVALLNASQLFGTDVVDAASRALGLQALPGQCGAMTFLPTVLRDSQQRGRASVLIIDEAHALGDAAMADLAELVSMDGDRGPLLHVVLFAHQDVPGVDVGETLDPLTDQQARDFLSTRLAASFAGSTPDHEIFDIAAVDLLIRQAGGNPGRLITLGDAAMRRAAEQGALQVTPHHLGAKGIVRSAGRSKATSPSGMLKPWMAGAGGVVVGAVVAATLLLSPTARTHLRAVVGLDAPSQTETQKAVTMAEEAPSAGAVQAEASQDPQPASAQTTSSSPAVAESAASVSQASAGTDQIEKVVTVPAAQPVALSQEAARPLPMVTPQAKPVQPTLGTKRAAETVKAVKAPPAKPVVPQTGLLSSAGKSGVVASRPVEKPATPAPAKSSAGSVAAVKTPRQVTVSPSQVVTPDSPASATSSKVGAGVRKGHMTDDGQWVWE